MIRENVQAFPRPPVVEAVPQVVVIHLGGGLAARSARALRVLETHHAPTYYLPPDDVAAMLRSASGTTFCEWKGVARYFDVTVGGATTRRAAWRYNDPQPPFGQLAGYFSFYAGLMDACWVGDMPVAPQAGDFYGGWVTPNLDGVVKGAPETRFW